MEVSDKKTILKEMSTKGLRDQTREFVRDTENLKYQELTVSLLGVYKIPDRKSLRIKYQQWLSINTNQSVNEALHAKTSFCVKCPHPELFWSAFSLIQTEYEEILRISPHSVGMRENTDQNNSEYGHFLRSARFCSTTKA